MCAIKLAQVRIDHRNGTLHFGSQQLENERVRGHMAQLSQRLSKVSSVWILACISA